MSEKMQAPMGTGSLNDPEPAPTGNGAPVWPLVIGDLSNAVHRSNTSDSRTDLIVFKMMDDMIERDQQGRAKYGTPLRTNNGRDVLKDAYQESLDLVVYLRQGVEEGCCHSQVYTDAMALTTAIRTMLYLRDKK